MLLSTKIDKVPDFWGDGEMERANEEEVGEGLCEDTSTGLWAEDETWIFW